jgi:hypothetical protein
VQRRAKLTPYSQIKREKVEWLEPGRVPLGALTILAGLPGLGKSQWTVGLAGRLSRGDLPCGEANAILATAEDHRAGVVKPRLNAVQANVDRVVEITMVLDEAEDGLHLPADTAELEMCVAEEQARLVIVDPLVAFLGAVDSWRDASVRQALAPLAALAERQGCAVVGVMHLNKSLSSDPFMRLGGSVGFGGAARSVLVLGRDPDDDDNGSRRVLAATKNNYGPLAPSLLYEVEQVLIPAFDDEPEVETSRLRLIGESEHDGPALLALRDDEERSALDDAENFLMAELATGRVKARDLQRDAREAGHSPRTLDRAKKNLGVESSKDSFSGAWYWALPTKDANPLGDLRETKDANPLGELGEKPHRQTGFGPDESPDPVEERQSLEMASFDRNGLTPADRRDLKHAIDQARRAELEEQAEHDRQLFAEDSP